ncbi:MAG: acetolactate synthase large subunit [Pseudomonadota bacterium]|jgi:acetolactate synthase-1/2/3 large subunit|nr:acetolactate synthase large subunit [Pseudomonadota bacterium]NLX30403.1 acetolactate synthase large subunit [Deltaproteobacteria bacterium]HNU85837.1 acetolactate synthase large subunit [Syntrophales bacterium]HNZ34831.1 acetolactate synthase large subunit [Syntrophales bacterium]HOF74025.1 acetolactate synthase large subunit [Syntrophales bacterium]
MNGAEALLKTIEAAGIDACFANGGTTEMPLILAFDSVTGIRPILGLFEGVCSGAADGYGRMKEKPALCLLHLGPGLANGVANLHNARRARTPLLNVIGEHASWHVEADAPLAMDIDCLCKTFSGWQRTVRSVETIARDAAEAIEASLRGQIASLIVPCDLQWKEYRGDIPAVKNPAFEPPDRRAIVSAAILLRSTGRTAIVMNGRALRRRGLEAAGRIRAAAGCDLFCINFPAYVDRGAGTVPVSRIPYFPEPAAAVLAPYRAVVLAGTDQPVNFFGYEGQSSNPIASEVPKLRIDGDAQDAAEALEALADELGAPGMDTLGAIVAGFSIPEVPTGRLTPEKACLTLAALQPEGAIIVDEGLTAGMPYFPLGATLAPHSYFMLTGGAIGQGMPSATGASVACPDRPVINLQADGSAMYTVQSLWTQAQAGMNVTTLICSNRSYNIINVELQRTGIADASPRVRAFTNLGTPPIDWPSLSRGLGVPGVAVETCEDLARELKKALREPGPHLIEMVL